MVLSKWFLFLAILLSALSLYSQKQLNDKVLTIKKKKNLTFDEKIKKTKALLKDEDFIINLENQSDAYHHLGFYNEKTKNYKQAIQELQKAIDIRESLPGLDYKLDNSLLNMSQQYLYLKDAKQQLYYLDKVIKGNRKNRFTYKAYNKLALILKNNGDYFKALQYLKIIIDSYDNYNDIKILSIAYKNAILIYSLVENLTESDIETIFLYSEEFEKKNTDNIKNIQVYNNLARIYKKIGNYEKATEYLKKSLDLALQYKEHERIAKAYANIAALHSEFNNHKLAKEHYDKALEITKNHVTIADIYFNQGFYLQTKRTLDKNTLYDKALCIVLGISNMSTSIKFLPTINNIKESPYKIDILSYLIEKANNFVLAYEEEQNPDYLKYSQSTLYLIDQLVSLIRFESTNNNSKLFWINKGVDSYMLGVKVSYLLDDKESAFYFMEKNKSLLLLENLNATQEKAKLNILDSILQREFNLRYSILSLEDKRRKSPKDKALTDLYLEKENTYIHFLDTLRKQHPDYFNSKKEPEILTLKDARSKYVSSSSNYMEYILNDDAGYGLFCDENSSILFEIQDAPKLLKELESLKELMNRPIVYEKDNKAYNDISLSIFKKIFPFKDALQSISNKKLTVVPDYKLKNLPFEALTTSTNTENTTYNYLIGNNVEISYYQSASVFKQIEKKERKAEKQLIGFAPIAFSDASLPSLERSETEMKGISSLLPTTLLTRDQATKEAFVSSLNDYDIIHINTHAGIDDDNVPWIAFSNEKMQLNELYGISNQANLVVLDACKSASGKLLKGEGLMSLSRGFFYSGSKSVIASLWNVNEKSNNEILVSFYKGIKEGQTKSKALHNAKLNYLNNHQNSELSPYFWSSLILTGDATAIEINDTSYAYSIMMGIVLLLLVLFFSKIKKFLLGK